MIGRFVSWGDAGINGEGVGGGGVVTVDSNSSTQ